MANFVHLHGHTEYSLLDGLSKIKKLVCAVKEMGMPAVAMTDHGVMYGAIEFYKACNDAGIKPLIGCEVYVAKRSHKDKEAKLDNEPYHLTLLAKDYDGYKNLMKLVSIAHLDGYYYKPRVDRELLKEFHNGIIALSGCPGGEFAKDLREGREKEAQEVAQTYRDIFGEGNYYLELQNHEYDRLIASPNMDPKIRRELTEMGEFQGVWFKSVKDLSKKLSLPIVATNDYHYVKAGDAAAQDALLCVQTGKLIADVDRLRMVDTPNLYIRSEEEMAALFPDLPEALDITGKIADSINFEIPLGKPYFPIFDIPQGKTPMDYLRELCWKGFKEKFSEDDTVRKERLEYELSVIEQKNYPTYFLIVWDFISWANEKSIIHNTRGSAAGSLVLYCLEVTNIDPVAYMLPFERFLNPFRPSLPDIDSDIADDRRDELIRHIMKKYGEEKVGHIVTFGTMMGRAAIRDVGRVLGMAYGDVDKIAKLVPPPKQGFHQTLDDALKEVPELNELYKNDNQIKALIDLAKQVEGTVRHASVHAAGLVIAPTALTDFSPIQRESNGDKIVTQYEMHAIEDVGLVKMDMLGIRNLSILGRACEIVKETRNIDVDLSKLPLDDRKTFQLLARGETMGLFQLEGSGMTKYLVDLAPTNFFDISAMIALYRPGPLSVIPEYIARKKDPSRITYFDERMKQFLERSLGLLVYQDDVLYTAITLAGYNWEEVDKFRKAMGKKIPEEMAKQKDKFYKGCAEYGGLSKSKTDEIWKLVEPFAAYGFNKCISGDTLLYDAISGERMTVKELYRSNKRPHLLSLEGNQAVRPRLMSAVQENGVKEVFKVTTRRGLSIKATNNHPFLVFDGWKELKRLKIGDRIGTARYAQLPQVPYPVEDFKLAALGYLLAEGNFCHPNGVYFYSKSEKEIENFISYASKFKNSRISINNSKPTKAIYIGKQSQQVENELFQWVKYLGLHGKRAIEKSIPDFVYQLDQNQLSLFLAKMWQGDGCISEKEESQFYYATSSEKLAFQMQHLLLRLKVISTVHKKRFKYRGENISGFTVNFSRYTNVRAFAETIGRYLIGDPLKILNHIMGNHPILSGRLNPLSARGSKDIIPTMVLRLVKDEMYKSHSSLSGFAMEYGIAERLFLYDAKKTGYLRETIQKIAGVLDSDKLYSIGNSDIYWDEIVGIEPMGKEMTYDLTIPETHNFAANDIIVHNSHAASYAMVSYQTAYMKANFPVEFMAAVMTAEYGDAEKIASAMEECKRMGIVVLPPDVNKSGVGFTIEDLSTLAAEDLQRSLVSLEGKTHNQAIRFGLSAIKNVGISAIESMIKARKKGGAFTSIGDICSRVDTRLVNRKTLESLIKSGGADFLGKRSAQLISLDEVLERAHQNAKKASMGQTSLFGEEEQVNKIVVPLPDIEELSLDQMLIFERDLLGFYLHEPPYLKMLQQVGAHITHPIRDINEGLVEEKITTGGVVMEVKKVITKKSQAEMAFVMLSDGEAEIEMVVFPKTFDLCKKFLLKDQVVMVVGKVDKREDELSLIADSISVFDPKIVEKVDAHEKEIEIMVPKGTGADVLKLVNKALRGYPGKYKVALLLPNGGSNLKKMELPFLIRPEELLIDEIEGILGKGTVKTVGV